MLGGGVECAPLGWLERLHEALLVCVDGIRGRTDLSIALPGTLKSERVMTSETGGPVISLMLTVAGLEVGAPRSSSRSPRAAAGAARPRS
jgi:hypothetical protein